MATASKGTIPTNENSPGDNKTKTKSKSTNKTRGRENSVRKKEKYMIVAKNKKHSNQEKKALELIHSNNPNKEDYDLIYGIIDKHFFMQTLNEQARNEIIVTMSLCKVKEGETLFRKTKSWFKYERLLKYKIRN